MRFTVARKLWLAFAIVLVLLAAVAVLSVISLSAARAAAGQLIETHGVVEAVDRSAESMLLERVLLTQYVATGESQYAAEAQTARISYWDSWATVVEYGAERQLEIMADLQEAAPEYSNLLDWALEAYEENPQDVRLVLSIQSQHHDSREFTWRIRSYIGEIVVQCHQNAFLLLTDGA